MAPHPYQSVPWQWMLNLRPVWFFYEPIEHIYRGVLLLGNPVIMWGGLFSIPAGLYLAARNRDPLLTFVLGCYLLSIIWWYASPKPVMFYHYYLFSSIILCLILAYVISMALSHKIYRKYAYAYTALSLLVFCYFYPILSAAPLSSGGDFMRWMWLGSWA